MLPTIDYEPHTEGFTGDRDDAVQDSPCPSCEVGPLDLKGYGMVCPNGHIIEEED